MKRTGMNMEIVKRNNRISILSLINQSGPISRKDIAMELGLTPAAVTQICAEFMERKILLEKGTLAGEGRAGRKKVLVDIDYEYQYVFGINIGSQRTIIALTNLKGEAKKVKQFATNKELEPEQYLHILAKHCQQMQAEAHLPDEKIGGIGVGIAGTVDKKSGKSIHAYKIWKEEVPVVKLLSSYLDKPVVLANNVTAFAFAEIIYGLGKESPNLLFVKWGPGVGSAIVANKQIYEGRNERAAEIGHFILKKNGQQCYCGRRGCLETLISYTTIKNRLEQIFTLEETPKMYQKLGGDFRNFSKEKFAEIVNDADLKVKEVLNEILDMFATTVVNAMTMLAPDRVILCGTLFENEILREALIQACISYEPRYNETKIVHTALAHKEDYIGPVALIVANLCTNSKAF